MRAGMASERQRSASEKRGRNVPLPRGETTPRARGAAAATTATPRGSSRSRVPSQQRSLLAAARTRTPSVGSRTPRNRTPRSSAVQGGSGAASNNASSPGATREAVRVRAAPSGAQPSSPSKGSRGRAAAAPSARASVQATARNNASQPRAQRRSSSLEQQVPYNEQIAFRKQRSDESVRVAVRFRPLWADEESQGVAFTVRPDRRIVESVDLTYSFELDWAFGAEILQSKVYSEIGHPVVSDVLNGYNGTVLAYGQTGSGKTYCMFGPQIEQPGSQGLMPRTARQIFDAIRAAPDDVRFVLRCSLLEIYCEQLRDLLDPSNQRPLRIQEHPKKGIFVDNLTQECVTCEEDVLDILRMGTEMRVLAATRLNKLSSRSHVLFFITCEQKFPDGAEKVGKLSLVDLAGSERVGKSGALTNGGIRLQEAKSINCSLTALGYIIQALAEKQSHVPYRNSQLTRVLQETIGGNCKTTLLVACSACSRHQSETLSTLRFATRARSVRNHVKVNLIHSAEQLDHYVRQLQRELLSERREAARLGAAIPKSLSELPFQEDDEDAAAGLANGTAGSTAPGSSESIVLASGKPRENSSATLPESSTSSEEQGPSKQELEAEYAASRLYDELSKLVSALGDQDEHIRSILAAKCRQVWLQSADKFGDALDPDSELLMWQAKRSSLEWRYIALQHYAEVSEADASAEDASADRHLGDLADVWEQVRVQRLNLRRQEAQSVASSNTVMGESALNCTEVGLDSMLESSGWLPAWASRARCLRPSRRGSKVLRPISRRSMCRSMERHSTGGASCQSSSCCSTPREPVGLLSPRRLEDADDVADEVHADPVRNLPGLHQPVLPDGDVEEEEASSPERSVVIAGPPNFLADSAAKVAPRLAEMHQSSNSRSASGGPVAATRAPGRVLAQPAAQAAAEEVLRLKAEIKQVRAEQDRTLREFESSRARIIEECWAKNILEHIRVLEEEHMNMQGEIPHLQSKLEQVDLALEELELVGDTTELEILQLECQLERQKRKLNRKWEPLEEMGMTAFKQALGRAVNTITLQRARSSLGRAVDRRADGARNTPQPAEKENRPPDTYLQSVVRQVPVPMPPEVSAPRSGQLAATALQAPVCTATQWRSPQRLYS
mmetsp:Transcript_159816/g.297948  ORF Transcript_159816/g.297948 Transcript_159816/m.297948 type:complete len:1129 (+) Transcript_159816:37-3423(+)